jgi:hypothetical protein
MRLVKKLHLSSELIEVNRDILPLKDLADRELASIRGLKGLVYTPHVDAYMELSIKKAEITACLKRQKILPLSEVERISAILDSEYKNARTNTLVEFSGKQYKRQFSPLKLSKSGKNVQKWAKFWLLQLSEGKNDPDWQSQVREIWPTYFLIRTIDL